MDSSKQITPVLTFSVTVGRVYSPIKLHADLLIKATGENNYSTVHFSLSIGLAYVKVHERKTISAG